MSPEPGRVHSRSTFRAFGHRARRVRSGEVAVAWVCELATGGGVRAAYGIDRRVGTAVVRNRVRRRLRAVMAEACRRDEVPSGSYLVSVSPRGGDLRFADLRTAVRTALRGVAEEAGCSARRIHADPR
jgi:ribonuclease P protein component